VLANKLKTLKVTVLYGHVTPKPIHPAYSQPVRNHSLSTEVLFQAGIGLGFAGMYQRNRLENRLETSWAVDFRFSSTQFSIKGKTN
jgi:hypothetical protein